MVRKTLYIKGLMALALPMALVGVAYGGGADCHKKDGQAAAAHASGEKGSHCHLTLTKSIVKTAKLTDDGAVVTLKGKTDEAVEVIQAHLENHERAGSCPNCPMSMDGVTATVKLNKKGGEVALTGASPETVKRVQEWAQKPAACCEGKESV